MSKAYSNNFAWWCAGTILLSAFLLFQVQPMISKMILPWFGGSPAVWTSCMLFFQVLLLVGYAYADFLAGLSRTSWQAAIHITLLLGALVLLPITPDKSWIPDGEGYPTGQILFLLLANVGLPYFLLSSTGPLVQAWFSRVYHVRSPYRLYALSNFGSLAALISYPFLFEPRMTTDAQGNMWSISFGVFAVICGFLAISLWRHSRDIASPYAEGEEEITQPPAGQDPIALDEPSAQPEPSTVIQSPEVDALHARPALLRRFMWLILPAIASMTLLAVTNHVCQDVAVSPFLWVVPLSLYLITFIIAFDSDTWYLRRTFSVLALLSILGVSSVMIDNRVNSWLTETPLVKDIVAKVAPKFDFTEYGDNVIFEASVYLIAMFFICMVCHGELARNKPGPRYLTSFYLMMACGGALGGVFTALVCPSIFTAYYEINISLAIGATVALHVLTNALVKKDPLHLWYLKVPVVVAGLAALSVTTWVQVISIDRAWIDSSRNFYGVLFVDEMYDELGVYQGKRLLNGRIMHGFQYADPELRLIPTTYYDETSGVALAMNYYPNQANMRVGVVGLGTGTMAAFGKLGDTFRFYEINPNVVKLCDKHFTYLTESQAEVEIKMGDARITMEREEPQDFDVLVLDAFSSDAIPAHLLTVEAIEVYLRHLNPQGILAIHISNRYLELTPVVLALAEHHNLTAIRIDSNGGDDYMGSASDWMLLTRNEDFLIHPEIFAASVDLSDFDGQRILWTDQYSNLFQVLK